MTLRPNKGPGCNCRCAGQDTSSASGCACDFFDAFSGALAGYHGGFNQAHLQVENGRLSPIFTNNLTNPSSGSVNRTWENWTEAKAGIFIKIMNYDEDNLEICIEADLFFTFNPPQSGDKIYRHDQEAPDGMGGTVIDYGYLDHVNDWTGLVASNTGFNPFIFISNSPILDDNITSGVGFIAAEVGPYPEFPYNDYSVLPAPNPHITSCFTSFYCGSDRESRPESDYPFGSSANYPLIAPRIGSASQKYRCRIVFKTIDEDWFGLYTYVDNVITGDSYFRGDARAHRKSNLAGWLDLSGGTIYLGAGFKAYTSWLGYFAPDPSDGSTSYTPYWIGHVDNLCIGWKSGGKILGCPPCYDKKGLSVVTLECPYPDLRPTGDYCATAFEFSTRAFCYGTHVCKIAPKAPYTCAFVSTIQERTYTPGAPGNYCSEPAGDERFGCWVISEPTPATPYWMAIAHYTDPNSADNYSTYISDFVDLGSGSGSDLYPWCHGDFILHHYAGDILFDEAHLPVLHV